MKEKAGGLLGGGKGYAGPPSKIIGGGGLPPPPPYPRPPPPPLFLRLCDALNNWGHRNTQVHTSDYPKTTSSPDYE